MTVTSKSEQAISLKDLQTFLRDQMQAYAQDNGEPINVTKFAKHMGVAQSNLSDVLHPTNPKLPKVDFFVKLARATNTDVRDIFALIMPDDVLHGSSRKTLTLALRLSKLSEQERKLADIFLTGLNTYLEEV